MAFSIISGHVGEEGSYPSRPSFVRRVWFLHPSSYLNFYTRGRDSGVYRPMIYCPPFLWSTTRTFLPPRTHVNGQDLPARSRSYNGSDGVAVLRAVIDIYGSLAAGTENSVGRAGVLDSSFSWGFLLSGGMLCVALL